MITVIHGTDADSSYKRFSQILSSYSQIIVQFDKNSTKDEIAEILTSRDLFDEKKAIIFKNLLKKDKNTLNLLENASKELEILCWETDELTPATVNKLAKYAKVENFKLPAKIFYFLDSITPGEKKVIGKLQNLEEDSGLIWNIQHRFLLLTLAKMRIDASIAGKITKRGLADWQWTKIRQQAKKFTLPQLRAIFHASLKIDYLIKSGQTNLSPTTLLSVMLLKYL